MAIDVPHCPVCDDVDECRHLLLEWHGWPGANRRGSLWSLVDRMESSIGRLLVECCSAHVPPQNPVLQSGCGHAAAATSGHPGGPELRGRAAGRLSGLPEMTPVTRTSWAAKAV